MTAQRVAALVQARQFERAIRVATTALATDPDSTTLWHLLALAQYGSGDHPAALTSIERALAAGSPSADVLVHHGWILAALGRPGAAVTAIEQALAADPGNAEAHSSLARALVAGGDRTGPDVHARALEHARCACELSPASPRPRLSLAVVLLARTDRSNAVRAAEPVRAALALEPDNAEALRLQALVDLRRRRAVGAVRGFAEALRLNPQDAVAARNLALATWILFARTHFVVVGMLVTALVTSSAASLLGPPGGPVARVAGSVLLVAAAGSCWSPGRVARSHRRCVPRRSGCCAATNCSARTSPGSSGWPGAGWPRPPCRGRTRRWAACACSPASSATASERAPPDGSCRS